MCEFCEGKTIKATACKGETLPLRLMLCSLLRQDDTEDKTNGVFYDKSIGLMGFDNSSGEYAALFIEINYCPVCGKNLNETSLKPTIDFVSEICELYGEDYDDRLEIKTPIGEKSNHKSLRAFQRELKEKGIDLSTNKILKILISGGKYSTEKSREIASIYQDYINQGCSEAEAVQLTAEDCELTQAAICMYLPYKKTAYKLENKTGNAKRCDKYRKRKGIDNG